MRAPTPAKRCACACVCARSILPPPLCRPEHLIFFRDGVSEGQFKEVYYVSCF